MYTTCLDYSIVQTRRIHGSDMSVHLYARWVGFQMLERVGIKMYIHVYTFRVMYIQCMSADVL
jgi:hypothetical protein